LYGKVKEDLGMDIPEGYSKYLKEKYGKQLSTKTHFLKLTKAIYCLVQAARQWWKKFKEVLKILGTWPSRADPCLINRKSMLMMEASFLAQQKSKGSSHN
jgi:hypothetical protein